MSFIILVKKFPNLQPSAALIQKIITESCWKSGGQSFFGPDGTLYLKICWPNFVKANEFSYFLGSEQPSTLRPGLIEENFHAAQIFRLAGAIGLPAIVHDTPVPSLPPFQRDPPETQALPAVPKGNNLPIKELTSTTNPKHQESNSGSAASIVSNNVPELETANEIQPTQSLEPERQSPSPELQQALEGEIQKLPPFSTSKAWYRENIFSSILNLPTLIRSEQSATRERERSQVISDVDRLCAALDTTTLEGQNINATPIHSDFNQSSGGSSNQTSSPVGGRGLSNLQGGERATNSDNTEQSLKRKGGQSNGGGGGEGSEGGGNDRKKAKASGPGSNCEFKKFQCRIHEKSGSGSSRCIKESFDTLRQMIDHLLRVHIKPVQCELCPARFGRGSECERHQKSCKSKGLVKRSDQDPNKVPKYVVDMGTKMGRCKDVGSLDLVLYYKNQKQYDLLDGTDVKRNSTSHPALEANQEVPGHPISRPALSIPIASSSQEEPKHITARPLSSKASQEHQQSERTTSDAESYLMTDGIESIQKLNGQFFNNHTQELQNLNVFGHDYSSDLTPEHDLTNDLAAESGEHNALEIEKILKGQPDAEKDPKRYKELMSRFLARLPGGMLDELISHIRGVPTNISPEVLFSPSHYALQVASPDNNLPVSCVSKSDSGLGSSNNTEISGDFFENFIHMDWTDNA